MNHKFRFSSYWVHNKEQMENNLDILYDNRVTRDSIDMELSHIYVRTLLYFLQYPGGKSLSLGPSHLVQLFKGHALFQSRESSPRTKA